MKKDFGASAHQRVTAMGQEKISKLLFRFSTPSIIAVEAGAAYEIFDALWTGRLGAEALAALSVAGPLMAIYRAIGAGIGVGGSSLIARHLGAKRKEEADRAACNSISLFFIVSGLVALICVINLEFLLRLFGANESVMPFAYSYMLIETLAMPIDFFLIVVAELIRTQGSPAVASAGSVIASAADIFWSPILVFGIGPFPAFGIAGAALGTFVGRVIGLAFLVPYLAFKSIYQFKRAYFVPKPRIVADIYSIGASNTLRMGAVSIAQILACRTAAAFGTIPLAVLGVLFRVGMINFGFCVGVSQGTLPLVGYNFGARKNRRIRELVIKAGIVSFIWGVIWCIAAMLFPTHILSLFNADPEFLAVGSTALRIFALGFLTVPELTLSSFFQGIGKAVPALIVSSSRQLLFLIPSLLIMPYLFGLTGLWGAYVVAGVSAFILGFAWTALEFRKLKVLETQEVMHT
ncbi:MAG: MATE family efflux transporter [Nitrososphaerota archaeon]|nr:MATE family efflux transporter [Candidatus Bathyarchaeota archaeon]MDW8023269.1 MATE family efflux transporter [Nitrososphaerota archaeon]